MHETSKAAAAYLAYAAMGLGRSLRKLAESGKPAANLRQLETWSSTHHWQDRVKVYDAEQAEEQRVKHEEALDRMNEEHALIGRTQTMRAIKQIEELIKAQKFGSQATVALLKMATDLERVARGAATERQAVEHSGEVGVAGTVGFYAAELPVKQPLPVKEGDADVC